MNAALALSVVGLVTCCCVYTSFICGALAIIFAFLSKGNQDRLAPMARRSVMIAVISYVFAGVVIALSLASIISHYGSLSYIVENYDAIYQDLLNQAQTLQ
ncbi:hypothetical protein SAMN02910417_02474 [Eubacterium oxidoreducens]|uniref:DUF4190 domain-containing protein n=2 Tax=Eubacterium oxidoreducens TaxID=1732 RepID=A0A1G6CKH9_EUBOX|nr:hypothetical protein SAMN02910417_02474 [Eubacterium oxidoreducens]